MPAQGTRSSGRLTHQNATSRIPKSSSVQRKFWPPGLLVLLVGPIPVVMIVLCFYACARWKWDPVTTYMFCSILCTVLCAANMGLVEEYIRKNNTETTDSTTCSTTIGDSDRCMASKYRVLRAGVIGGFLTSLATLLVTMMILEGRPTVDTRILEEVPTEEN